MSGLLLFLLLGLLAVYAVFFLFFKVIWKLCKKDRNKWPLILAGICTALLTACVIGAAVWGVYKVMEPLRPIQQRLAAHPQPIYGTRTYKDPVYPLSFQISDGMDFSEWISLSDVKVKLGINTNLFRKDAKGHSIKSPAL